MAINLWAKLRLCLPIFEHLINLGVIRVLCLTRFCFPPQPLQPLRIKFDDVIFGSTCCKQLTSNPTPLLSTRPPPQLDDVAWMIVICLSPLPLIWSNLMIQYWAELLFRQTFQLTDAPIPRLSLPPPSFFGRTFACCCSVKFLKAEFNHPFPLKSLKCPHS